MGILSNSEKNEEDMLLNPGKIEQIEQKRREIQDVSRKDLMDENLIDEKARKRFEGQYALRSIHPDIAPAKDRVQDYKRKCFGRLFNGIAVARENGDDGRPASSATSSGAFADLTT